MGGSLAGLTAALVLRDLGCEVEVHERSPTPLESRGAGIVLHPVTVRYFTTSGSLDIGAISTRAEVLRYVDRQGRTVHEQPCRYLFTSYYALHRALLDCFGCGRYHLGSEVTDFEIGDEVVQVELGNGSRRECEFLVCADGIHSTARRLLLPGVQPRYAGYVGWRGTVGPGDLPASVYNVLNESITYHVGPDTHILTYPIPDHTGAVSPDRVRINFVWYVNVDPDDLEDLLTDREGRTHSLSVGPGAVQPRHIDALKERAEALLPRTLAGTVLHADEPFVQAVVDIAVPRMAFGRACLIGDAAFAIRPHAAAGTAKAADDAWSLALALRQSGGDVRAALSRWEPLQLEVGRRVLFRAREIGERSQFRRSYVPGDPYLLFGLYEPGDSRMPVNLRAP